MFKAKPRAKETSGGLTALRKKLDDNLREAKVEQSDLPALLAHLSRQPSEEWESSARALLSSAEKKALKMTPLLEALASFEVKSTPGPMQIFRTDSFCLTAMKVFVQNI